MQVGVFTFLFSFNNLFTSRNGKTFKTFFWSPLLVLFFLMCCQITSFLPATGRSLDWLFPKPGLMPVPDSVSVSKIKRQWCKVVPKWVPNILKSVIFVSGYIKGNFISDSNSMLNSTWILQKNENMIVDVSQS